MYKCLIGLRIAQGVERFIGAQITDEIVILIRVSASPSRKNRV